MTEEEFAFKLWRDGDSFRMDFMVSLGDEIKELYIPNKESLDRLMAKRLIKQPKFDGHYHYQNGEILYKS